MGRRRIYRVTKEDSADITGFKEWVENLMLNRAEKRKTEQETDDFDYDGLSTMFDFSLTMKTEKEEQKTIQTEKETTKTIRETEEYVKQEEVSVETTEPYIQPELAEEFSAELENDTEFDDFEK